jgi:competence protein ComEA
VPELLRPPPPVSWRDRLLAIADTVRSAAPAMWVAVGLALAVAGAVFLLARGRVGGAPTADIVRLPRAGDTTASSLAGPAPAEPLIVHAAGAVTHPGVYRVPGGSRVNDVVNAAGGPAADADLDQLDLAAKVGDGDRVYVPRRGEAAPPVAGGTGAAGPLDLNRATVEQLDALPGVGPATARSIVDWRTRRGRFRSVQELLDVPGIGPSKLDRLRALVVVR